MFSFSKGKDKNPEVRKEREREKGREEEKETEGDFSSEFIASSKVSTVKKATYLFVFIILLGCPFMTPSHESSMKDKQQLPPSESSRSPRK